MAKKRALGDEPRRTTIPPDQMDLPISFDASGKMVTLREAKARRGSVLSFTALSPEKRTELTVKRIEAQPTFEVAMIDGGIVGKARAIEEVKAQTNIGRVLTEIEQRVIQNLLEVVRNNFPAEQ